MVRTIVAIGGGELRSKETAIIDAYVSKLTKQRVGQERRANALFFPTASHDSLPYFNTFRKTYTSDNGLKCDVALLTKMDIPLEKIQAKIDVADLIYVGGGDTLFMLDIWKKTGVDKMILQAYERGVIICGLSAGAICWFKKMYSDADIMNGGKEYKFYDGLNVIDAEMSPHYQDRVEDLASSLIDGQAVYGVNNKSALVFEDERLLGYVGEEKSYLVAKTNGTVTQTELNRISEDR